MPRTARQMVPERRRQWFAPASVAVVGASARPGNAGASYLRALLAGGYAGSLAAIHPSGEPVLGVACRPTATALDDAPDLGIVAVPGPRVLDAVADLADAGCRAVHVFSGGFDELGAGASAQAELVALAASRGIELLGPNCMGVHRPEAGLTFRSDLPMLPGRVGIVAQSGGVAINLILLLAARGIGTSAVVSYGNAAVLDASWWAEAVADLPETAAVVVHAESQGGPELAAKLDALRRRVPVVLLRPRGDRGWHDAARRHTGAPGGSGVPAADLPAVHALEDACDIAELAMLDRRAPHGRTRAAFVSISGGVGVFAAGEFAAAGNALTPIPADLRGELEALDGTSLVAGGNPIDLGPRFLSRRLLSDVVARLTKSDAVDVVIVHVPWDSIGEIDAGRLGYAADFLESIRTFASWGPVVAYFPTIGLPGEDAARQSLRSGGVAVSTSLPALAAWAALTDPEEMP